MSYLKIFVYDLSLPVSLALRKNTAATNSVNDLLGILCSLQFDSRHFPTEVAGMKRCLDSGERSVEKHMRASSISRFSKRHHHSLTFPVAV